MWHIIGLEAICVISQCVLAPGLYPGDELEGRNEQKVEGKEFWLLFNCLG